jgi:hypothetical protein
VSAAVAEALSRTLSRALWQRFAYDVTLIETRLISGKRICGNIIAAIRKIVRLRKLLLYRTAVKTGNSSRTRFSMGG